ncbi:MAG: helix-turn-helix transcriptional regulator, partial [Lentisphaerae bacterium]|nr:helix-turn-helix transcriptional regulator [Lentisphaerota bacterium]
LSVRTFLRRFHEVTGESCQDWFRRRRIQQACLLLHLTRRGIDQIAAECGFCDRHHFSRVFKELRGIPPATYRRISVHLNRPFENQTPEA